MRSLLALTVLALGLVGCSSEPKEPESSNAPAAAPAPAATAAGGENGSAAPEAVQGGHFVNPNATITQPGSKL